MAEQPHPQQRNYIEHEVCDGCGVLVDCWPEDCSCEFTGRTTVRYIRADAHKAAVDLLRDAREYIDAYSDEDPLVDRIDAYLADLEERS